MRQHWHDGRIEEAIALAKAAAPYLHGKPRPGLAQDGAMGLLGDKRLDELCTRGVGGETPARQPGTTFS